jgi:hypothetical protein
MQTTITQSMQTVLHSRSIKMLTNEHEYNVPKNRSSTREVCITGKDYLYGSIAKS